MHHLLSHNVQPLKHGLHQYKMVSFCLSCVKSTVLKYHVGKVHHHGIFFPPIAYVNYIPLGTAVIEVGNNLHLILPDNTFPVASSSIPVTPVLTPISPMQTSMVAVKQSCPLPAISPLQRTRSTAPILIPALARKSLTPNLASTHSGAAAPVSASAAMAVKVRPGRQLLLS